MCDRDTHPLPFTASVEVARDGLISGPEEARWTSGGRVRRGKHGDDDPHRRAWDRGRKGGGRVLAKDAGAKTRAVQLTIPVRSRFAQMGSTPMINDAAVTDETTCQSQLGRVTHIDHLLRLSLLVAWVLGLCHQLDKSGFGLYNVHSSTAPTFKNT
jgi:hypothetical protein